MSKSYVLDACALIALVREEDGADIVTELYEETQSGDAALVINVVNLLEVYYGFRRERGSDFADVILRNVEDSIVEVAEVGKAVLREAGRIKAEHKRISLADAIAIAEANVRGGVLVTADHHEMDVLDKAGVVNFLWFR